MKIDSNQENEIVSRWKNGQGIRAISRDLSLGRHVISRIVSRHLAQTGSREPTSDTVAVGPIRLTRKTKLDPYLDDLHQLLDRYPKLTAQRAFEELRKLGYVGSYSTVRNHVKAYRPKTKTLTVRFETAPGAQAQMDWSTYTIDFAQEGRRRVELFSYILGYSRRQYICFTQRQDFETTIRQHIAAFEHMGGVAAVCLYDNMKVVVTRWEDGQPIYNTRFLSLATHYGYKPWACAVVRPQTKGKVERPFDYAEKNLLNGRTFRSLEHLNETTRWWLAEVNDRRIHGTTKRTPLELYELEKAHLIPLPSIRFDTAQVVYRVVDSEGYINYANNQYSVPWQLIGQMLPIRILEDQLHVYNASVNQVATHNLLRGRNQKQTNTAHLPPKDHVEQLEILRGKYAKANWELLSQREQDALQQLTETTRVEARRSEEYQQLFDQQDEAADDEQIERPPRVDPPVSGDTEDEDDRGAA